MEMKMPTVAETHEPLDPVQHSSNLDQAFWAADQPGVFLGHW